MMDLARLIKIRRDQPLMERQRVTRGLVSGPALIIRIACSMRIPRPSSIAARC
jgi:hypothetical protein